MSAIYNDSSTKPRMILKGRCHLIKDSNGKLINNIDTDMIFHNAHLAITDIKEMGKFTFGNLADWKQLPQIVKPNDILVVGENFGSGSSRQQAVDCFRALGMAAIIGLSFGAIYKRNAINTGWPLFETLNLNDTSLIGNGDEIEINLEISTITNLTKGQPIPLARPFSPVQMDIYLSGGLFAMKAK